MRILKTVLILSIALLPLTTVSAAADQAPAVAVETADVVLDGDLFLAAPEAMAGQSCKGKPRKDCYCIMVYEPVCGCDGVTYSNSCFAQCEGLRSWTDGPCA